jgi:hypothetical protein
MHAAASVLVLVLAQQLFACLEGPPPPPPSMKSPSAAGASQSPPRALRGGRQSPALSHKRGSTSSSSSRGEGAGGGGVGRWGWSELLQWQWQPCLWRVGSPSAQLQAWVCALLFALHPVHTEVRADKQLGAAGAATQHRAGGGGQEGLWAVAVALDSIKGTEGEQHTRRSCCSYRPF